MADEGTNIKLQQSLDALPMEEREAVNAIWSNFSYSSHTRRALILHGLLTMCCFSQLSLLSEQLAHLIRLDPFSALPLEVSLKILGYLDAMSLCRAAQVSRLWKRLADDDALWRGICEQHIGQKCRKCGWSLPVLEAKRSYRGSPAPTLNPMQPSTSKRPPEDISPQPRAQKRQKTDGLLRPPVLERQQSDTPTFAKHVHPYNIQITEPPASSAASLLTQPIPSDLPLTRPWKSVYSERLTVERNWRRGRCAVRTFKGHTDGVMCLQYNDSLPTPSFPVLISGSYDRTVRVWNMETGKELHCLKGHTRAVRALQFDNCKLITGSMDHTIRVWDWRRGTCIRTLHGHSEGVVCLNFDSTVLASGGVDTTIRIWNLKTGGAFTLRGHDDWVNAVQLWDSRPANSTGPVDSALDFADSSCQGIGVDPGKMLFSASDDGTIRLWDLNLRTCVRQFVGHMGQVQSMRVVLADCDVEESEPTSSSTDEDLSDINTLSPKAVSRALSSSSSQDSSLSPPRQSSSYERGISPSTSESGSGDFQRRRKQRTPVLISGSLDNTVKVWNIESGKNEQTLFGHIEGVWAVGADKTRLVSGSHDRTIKVWSREDGSCVTTLIGHRAAVTSLVLGEDKLVSGSDDGDVRIWDFSKEVKV